ncbi:alpha/beta hydrolase [Oxalicibacterium flavum]|nr:alpha/beta hydrolase [Oxalicibacterium flavum]
MMQERQEAIYRGMDKAVLDAAYNNTLAVRDSALLLQGFDARSAALRERHPAHLDLRYGNAPRNRIDYFAADRPGPLLVFIHGGYWQMRAKETFSFIAEGPLAHGFHVALIGYTLAPEQNLTGIVREVREGLAWLREHAPALGGDASHMFISGWSAGGHLTAMCLDEPGVAGGVAISGIYDLEPIRLCYLNEKLSLSDEEERMLSPLRLPPSARPLVLAYGCGELDELQRQSTSFASLRQALPGSLLPLPEHNHFTILNELASAQGAIMRSLTALRDERY